MTLCLFVLGGKRYWDPNDAGTSVVLDVSVNTIILKFGCSNDWICNSRERCLKDNSVRQLRKWTIDKLTGCLTLMITLHKGKNVWDSNIRNATVTNLGYPPRGRKKSLPGGSADDKDDFNDKVGKSGKQKANKADNSLDISSLRESSKDQHRHNKSEIRGGWHHAKAYVAKHAAGIGHSGTLNNCYHNNHQSEDGL